MTENPSAAEKEFIAATERDLALLDSGKKDVPPPPDPEEKEAPEAETDEPPAPEVKTEPKKETVPPVKPAVSGKPSSIFDDIKKKTQHDGPEKSKIEQISNLLLDDVPPDATSEEEDSPEMKKANANATAAGWVTVIDLLFMLLCKWAASDWEEAKNGEAKYSLHPNRQKAIKNNIYQIIMLKKKKSNPFWSLFGIILTSYIPMLVLAFISGRKRRRERDQKTIESFITKQNTTPPPQQERKNEYTAPEVTLKSKEGVEIKFQKPIHSEVKSDAKGKQGRHKKWCTYYTDKKNCNCK